MSSSEPASTGTAPGAAPPQSGNVPAGIVPRARGFRDGDPFFVFSQYAVGGILRAASRIVLKDVNRCPAPDKGPLILASSHLAYADIPLLGAFMPRPPIFFSKSEVESWPVLGAVGARYGTIYVRRGEADRQAIRDALACLAARQMLTIFPEGHRNKGRGLLQAQPGISLMALRGGASVWPVAIDGSHLIFNRLRPTVSIRGGEPFNPRDLLGSDGKTLRDHQELANIIMRRIRDLLPARAHGVYA